MPELPEVETMRRGILSVVGMRISGMRIPASPLRPITIEPSAAEFRGRIVGRRIVSVGRCGKRVLVELDSAERIVIEPRMTGRVLLGNPPDRKHLRLVFTLARGRERGAGDGKTELLFWDSRGLGVVRLLTPEGFARQLGPETLGPDALQITVEQLQERLGRSRRAVKAALLDQKVLAGVGNIYASELLHRARIHPGAACCRLRPIQWRRLHAAMRDVLQEALEHEGTTLADGMYQTVQGESGRYQQLHRVYQRARKLCLQCGRGIIVRIVQAQRSSFYCPRCQRANVAHGDVTTTPG